MAKEKETFEKEIHEIRSELTNLRADLKRFLSGLIDCIMNLSFQVSRGIFQMS